VIWDIPVSHGFTNRTVTWRSEGTATNAVPHRRIFRLTPGPHQVVFRGGEEAGARLDRIAIARIPSPPGNIRIVVTP
jgi:hypothetical protein